MLLICPDPDAERRLTPQEGDALGAATRGWLEETEGRGVRIQGGRLRPPSDARTVRIRDEDVLVAEGPFAETKEHLIGYSLLECGTRHSSPMDQ